jgi:hypothetical protein
MVTASRDASDASLIVVLYHQRTAGSLTLNTILDASHAPLPMVYPRSYLTAELHAAAIKGSQDHY